ncbi:NADH-quinone oxidoreductase subunit A [bacterium]|nr:NADH-quinone oxidoreductase subunit A [bacterium]
MDHPYFPILIVLLVGIGFSALFLTLSAVIGPKKRKASAAKLSSYECGLNPIGSAREQLDIKFSNVAMLFILFDIETVFMFPWAILYKDSIKGGMGTFMFVEMAIFVVILVVGLAYIWRKGALEWK